jgi:iron complex outermembrane receptor protein
MVAIDRFLGDLTNNGHITRWREANPDGYLVFDARTSYQITDGLKASLILRNIFNEEYTKRPGLLESPRNITLRLDYRL